MISIFIFLANAFHEMDYMIFMKHVMNHYSRCICMCSRYLVYTLIYHNTGVYTVYRPIQQCTTVYVGVQQNTVTQEYCMHNSYAHKQMFTWCFITCTKCSQEYLVYCGCIHSRIRHMICVCQHYYVLLVTYRKCSQDYLGVHTGNNTVLDT